MEQEDCERRMKLHYLSFLAPCGCTQTMGYRLKRYPLSKDEKGKHSKTKHAEKSLSLDFASNLLQTCAIPLPLIAMKCPLIGMKCLLNELQHPLNETKNALNQSKKTVIIILLLSLTGWAISLRLFLSPPVSYTLTHKHNHNRIKSNQIIVQ